MPWTPSNNPTVRERWRARVDAQRGSGLTLRAFARREGIGAESLYRWRTWFRRQDESVQTHLPALVEVRVVEEEVPVAVTTMVVELCSGRRLVLEPGFDGDAVTRLIGILERR